MREHALSVTSSTDEYYLPNDFDKVIDIRQTDTPIQLRRTWLGNFDRLVPDPSNTSGDPTHYMLLLEERVKDQPTTSNKVVMLSTSNEDIASQTGATYANIYGVSGGVDRIEQVSLSATNVISSTNAYTKLYSIAVDLEPVGTLRFTQTAVGTEFLELYPGEKVKTYKKIKLYPKPNSSTSIYIKYQCMQPYLTNDYDRLVIPERYSNVLVQMVVADMLLKQGDEKAAATFQLAEKMLQDVRRDEEMFWDYTPVIRAQSDASMYVSQDYPFMD